MTHRTVRFQRYLGARNKKVCGMVCCTAIEDAYSLVPKLMGDSVGQHDAVVLVHGAAAVWLAHTRDVRHAQGAVQTD